MLQLIFSDDRKPGKTILAKIHQAAEICFIENGLEADRFSISVSFVSSEEIRELNLLYRKIDKTTDVLSFPQYEDIDELPKEGDVLLGDVVICTEQALLQADEFGHTPERELTYLFVHSILHLLGYDHEIEEEKAGMRQLEEKIMAQVGLSKE